MSFFKENYKVKIEREIISEIPITRLSPEDYKGPMPTVVFYHGLGSNSENQIVRGFFLAALGNQVILPDSIHHGKREAKETEDPQEIFYYFCDAILTSVKEGEKLVKEIRKKYNPGKIFFGGHSMGGFITAGALASGHSIHGGFVVNGSMNWERSFELGPDLEYGPLFTEEMIKKIESLDPVKDIKNYKDKDILLINGQVDEEVDIRANEEFVEKYGDELERLKFSTHEGVGHFITTGMLEEIARWLRDKNE